MKGFFWKGKIHFSHNLNPINFKNVVIQENEKNFSIEKLEGIEKVITFENLPKYKTLKLSIGSLIFLCE